MTIFNSYFSAQRTTKQQLWIDAWFQQNQADDKSEREHREKKNICKLSTTVTQRTKREEERCVLS